MTTDIMLDLETLSTAPDAAIVAIGACTFSTDGRTLTEGERRTFYAPVDLESSQRHGGRIDAATVRWWMAQSDAARQVFSGKEGIPLPAALLAFSAFCGTDDNIRIWGNGAAFDNIILRQAYQRCELPTPWKYAGDRCFRTLKALRDFGSEYLVKPAVAHNALSDALAQAATAERIFAETLHLNSAPPPGAAAIEALKAAVEGECDGLAIDDAQATAILDYVYQAERAEAANSNHLLERVAAVEKELFTKYSGNSVHDMVRQWYENTVPGRPTLNILRLTRIITEYIKERAEAVTDAEPNNTMWTAGGAVVRAWRDKELIAGVNDVAVLVYRAMRAVAPKPEPSPDVDYFATLVNRARTAATKATAKFPQPNYVTLKIAEEAGEVVRGAVHYAEGRMPWDEVEGEIVQLLAMLIRFVTEGDQINGMTPPDLTKPEGK